MSDEPNLRALERALTGQPQGWGEFPPGKPSRPLPTQAAEVAPAQACEPEPQPKLRAPIPGFWMSLAGIAVTPLRVFRWTFRTPTRACVPIILIIGFLAIPLFTTTGGRDRPAREGEHLLGDLRNEARAAFALTESEPWTLIGAIEDGGAAVDAAELEGKYFTVDPRIEMLPDGQARLRAYPRPQYPEEPTICLTFKWAGGDGSFDRIYPGDSR